MSGPAPDTSPTALRWTVHPAAREPLRAALVLVILLGAGLFARAVSDSWAVGAVALLLLAWSVRAYVGDQLWHTAKLSILALGTFCALAHFVFTYKRTRLLAGVSRVGIVILMITFGSMFGFTVLGRIALLIERVDWLARFNEAGYALFGSSLGLGQAVFLSPPFVITGLITALLALGALQSRGKSA